MTRRSLYFFFIVAIQSFCCADVTKFATANPFGGGLSPENRKLLQDSSRFHEVHSTGDLPPAVVALCTNGVAKLAEPRQKWNATDAISDPTLPAKRLILGSGWRRLLRCPLRARRNRSYISDFSCETLEE
jgi:hypothetical protein